MPDKLHIIEPTLNSSAGHCFSVTQALARANKENPIASLELWADRHMDDSALNILNVKTHSYFSRKIRRIQVFFLLLKLLSRGDTVFLQTTSRAELAAYALLPKKIKLRGNAYFYIHHMRMDGLKKKRLEVIAKNALNARILCTTEQLATSMREAGFEHVKVQLYPFETPEAYPKKALFRHLIFPGIARMDKNFPFIASIVNMLKQHHEDIPLFIQAAPNHHNEFPADILPIIKQIQDTEYAHLKMPCTSLNSNDYLAQFSGGLCLLPYNIEVFADKVSGVTLDALAHGCPVIIQKGMHSANLVNQFQAGISLEHNNEEAWLVAIKTIICNYGSYQINCHKAFDFLSKAHHPARILETIIRWR